MELCNRVEKRIYAKKEKSIFTVKREKKEGTSIYKRLTTKRIYLVIKITTDLTSPFIAKKNSKRRIVQDYHHIN